jgi:hypothetical protein
MNSLEGPRVLDLGYLELLGSQGSHRTIDISDQLCAYWPHPLKDNEPPFPSPITTTTLSMTERRDWLSK